MLTCHRFTDLRQQKTVEIPVSDVNEINFLVPDEFGIDLNNSCDKLANKSDKHILMAMVYIFKIFDDRHLAMTLPEM